MSRRFTDLPEDIVASIVADWGDVRTLSKIDSAMCSNESNCRLWFLNLLSIKPCHVEDSMRFSFHYLMWVLIRQIKLSRLRINILYSYFPFIVKTLISFSHLESVVFEKFDKPMAGKRDNKFVADMINSCPMLKRLQFTDYEFFKMSDFVNVSPIILGQLTELSLTYDNPGGLANSCEILPDVCHNLTSLTLCSSETTSETTTDLIYRMIEANPKLLTIIVGSRNLDLDLLSDSLKSVCNTNNGSLSITGYKQAPLRLANLIQQNMEVFSSIGMENIIQFNRIVTPEGRVFELEISIPIGYFDFGPIFDLTANNVRHITLKPHFWDHRETCLYFTIRMINERFASTLASVQIVEHSYKPSMTSGSVELLLRSCQKVAHVHFMNTDKASFKRLEQLWKQCPNLTHIEFTDCGKVDSAVIIAILKQLKNSVTKVTTHNCCNFDSAVVNEAVVKMNSKKIVKKIVQFVCL